MPPTPRPCSSCQVLVWDLRHERTHKPAPIEVAPAADGNIHVDLDAGTYRLVGRDLRPGRETLPRYRSHFASCPQAGSWRRKLPSA